MLNLFIRFHSVLETIHSIVVMNIWSVSLVIETNLALNAPYSYFALVTSYFEPTALQRGTWCVHALIRWVETLIESIT